MVLIVDYGMSNLRSVAKAVERMGVSVRTGSRPEELEKADKVILPGVGAFGDAMLELERRGLVEPIRRVVAEGKPFLGICLGLQLLFESSEESPGCQGLGLLRGSVVRFKGVGGLKIPHMGWNEIWIRKPECPILQGIPEGSFFYFVHSYFVEPFEHQVVLAETEYGGLFTSMIWKENLFGAQFHPEKSQDLGLQMIQNFVRLS